MAFIVKQNKQNVDENLLLFLYFLIVPYYYFSFMTQHLLNIYTVHWLLFFALTLHNNDSY